jgi:hypothetical protein
MCDFNWFPTLDHGIDRCGTAMDTKTDTMSDQQRMEFCMRCHECMWCCFPCFCLYDLFTCPYRFFCDAT